MKIVCPSGIAKGVVFHLQLNIPPTIELLVGDIFSSMLHLLQRDPATQIGCGSVWVVVNHPRASEMRQARQALARKELQELLEMLPEVEAAQDAVQIHVDNNRLVEKPRLLEELVFVIVACDSFRSLLELIIHFVASWIG